MKSNLFSFNQLTVIDEYTRHKYMELAMVATVNWLNDPFNNNIAIL